MIECFLCSRVSKGNRWEPRQQNSAMKLWLLHERYCYCTAWASPRCKKGKLASAAIHVWSRCRIWIHSLAHKYESDSFLIVLYVSAVLWMFDYSMWWHVRCCSGHYEFSLAECLSDIGRICYRYYRETTIWYICDLRLWPYGTTANILSRLIILDLFLSAYEHNTNKYQGMHHRYCKSSQRTIQWTKFMYWILVRWW